MVETDEYIKLTPDGGVKKRIVVSGEEGPTPEKEQEVLVNYTGRLPDGTIFDSSENKEALKFILGVGQVIKGWDIGIGSMKLGEKAELHIEPEYGYGVMGNPPTIPANTVLIFDVELLQVSNRRPSRNMMSDQELIAAALRLKDDGNIKFKEQKYKQAEGHYRDSLAHVQKCRVENDEVTKL